MNDTYTVLDLIEVLRLMKEMSSRQLAISANVSTATLASLINRKPATISIETLDRLANVFGARWYELLNKPASIADEYVLEKRVPVVMSRSNIAEVGYRLTGNRDFMVHVDRLRHLDQREDRSSHVHRKETSSLNEQDRFKESLSFVLDKLNDDGLMEAMRRIVDVANDPKYRKSNIAYPEEAISATQIDDAQ